MCGADVLYIAKYAIDTFPCKHGSYCENKPGSGIFPLVLRLMNQCSLVQYNGLDIALDLVCPWRAGGSTILPLSLCCDTLLTRQLPGYFATHHLLGGRGVKRPQPITREPMAAARRARRQTKDYDKTILVSTYNFNFEVTGLVKYRSNTQNWTFSNIWTSRPCAGHLSS